MVERARSFLAFQLGGAAAAIRSLLKSTRRQHLDQPKAQSAAGVSARRPPLKTAFGGTNHHHGPCEPSLRSFRTGLRRGGAKIPEIRKHPPETGPKTGLKTASTLSAVEPVSAPPKRKLENRHQRPEPETRPARAEMPEIADQRLGHPSLTCGNVGDSPPPGNNTPETGLAG